MPQPTSVTEVLSNQNKWRDAMIQVSQKSGWRGVESQISSFAIDLQSTPHFLMATGEIEHKPDFQLCLLIFLRRMSQGKIYT